MNSLVFPLFEIESKGIEMKRTLAFLLLAVMSAFPLSAAAADFCNKEAMVCPDGSTATRLPPSCNAVCSPTANLTVSSRIMHVNVGDTINFDWDSTNGTDWRARYFAANCTDPSMNTYWTLWRGVANTANGSSMGFIVGEQFAGCVVLLEYDVYGSDGSVATDKATIKVAP